MNISGYIELDLVTVRRPRAQNMCNVPSPSQLSDAMQVEVLPLKANKILGTESYGSHIPAIP